MRFEKLNLRARISASVAVMGMIAFLILPSSLWSRLPGTQNAAAKNGSPVPQNSVRQSQSAPVVQNGKIAFVSQQDGHSQIFVINPDGSDQTQLTSGGSDNYSPAWSPDGMKLTFVSKLDGLAQIYVMNADGSNQTRVTNETKDCTDPAWSPDGTRIAFSHDSVDIFTINADGSNQIQLTQTYVGGSHYRLHPTWSPDGKKIAFTNDYFGLSVINLDNDTEAILLPSDFTQFRAPAWSPDGARIAFVGENRAGMHGLQIMNAIEDPIVGRDSDGTTTISRAGLILNNQINGYNDANPAWSPDGTKLAFENSGTIYIIEDYRSEFTRLVDGTQPAWQPLKTSPAATPPPVITTLQFDRPFYEEDDNIGGYYYTIVVTRLGDTSGAVTVDYATSNGTASDRSEFTPQFGTLRFAPGVVSTSFDIFITHTPSSFGKTITLTLSNPTGGAVLSGQSTSLYVIRYSYYGLTANPIDDTSIFVRQHYLDFLNREPDEAGGAFWAGNIDSCGQDAQCIDSKRADTSAAFFLSIEFQNTGYFVYRFYRAAFNRQPLFAEFLPDTQQIGQGVVVAPDDSTGWKETLEANKQAYADSFVQRAPFVAQYGALSNSQYVDELIANTGVKFSQPDRDALVGGLDNGTETRATVLRKVAENQAFYASEFNPAFVLMQYFGYLRRNPSDAPDHDLSGYNFWLQKLNEFGGDYQRAEMVRAFIVSAEYKQRFGS